MIYRANNNPLVLTEGAADEFLESVGVRLFEDEISIDGTLYEGAYGESILEENGIFLYEDGIVLEGKQAEEYMVRKANERQAEDNRWEKKYGKRMGDRRITTTIVPKDRPYHDEKRAVGDQSASNNYSVTSGGVEHNRVRNTNLSPSQKIKHAADHHKKYLDAHMTVSKIADKREYENKWANDNQKVNPINTKFNLAYATDAQARHDRKNAKKYGKTKNESTIFSDIEII